jgi:hypothetical protein
MRLRLSLLFAVLTLSASSALAIDFGVHAGYYGNDLKEAFVGADLNLPLGPVAIVPNIDYARKSGVGYWFASGDLALRYKTSGGPSYWFGAGPTYGYWDTGTFTFKEWGWDANAGFGWTAAGFKPYVTGRYIKIKDFKTLGAAIGLRF